MQSLCRKGEATAELLNDIQVVALAGVGEMPALPWGCVPA